MKQWFPFLLLSVICLLDPARSYAVDSRTWTARTGSKLHGTQVGCADGRIVLSAGTIRRPRNWINKSGKTLQAELRGVQKGGKLFLKTPAGRGYFIPVATLSGRDQAYALASISKSIDYETILAHAAGPPALKKNFWPSTLSFPSGGITRPHQQRGIERGEICI
ncbi:MAG: hypothetical protein P1V20_24600 [Verrucomicrobiales bacterium]|nr:hypothetical protein [Verrucomicrobiales bacterium]